MKPATDNINSFPASFTFTLPCSDRPLDSIGKPELLNHMKTCSLCREAFHWLLKEKAA